MTRPIRIAPRAATEIEEVSNWWFKHRPAAPGLFIEEIERAFAMVREMPGVGQPVVYARRPAVRRLFLGRVRYHLYYVDTGEVIESACPVACISGDGSRCMSDGLWFVTKDVDPPFRCS